MIYIHKKLRNVLSIISYKTNVSQLFFERLKSKIFNLIVSMINFSLIENP